MSIDETNVKDENQQQLLKLRVSVHDEKKKRVEEKSGGSGVLIPEKSSAEVALAEAEAAAFAAMKLKDDVICSLWHNKQNTKICIVRFGHVGTLKMVIPLDLEVSDVMPLDHPVLGEIRIVIEQTDSPSAFTADEMRLSDLFWDFLDEKKRCTQRFPICVTNPKDVARMLAQYDLQASGSFNEPAESPEFIWVSRVREEDRCYAVMEVLTNVNAKSPFPHPDKAATFEE